MPSTSATIEGTSSVTCEFAWGTNLDEASNDVRSNLERIRNALPEDADAPIEREGLSAGDIVGGGGEDDEAEFDEEDPDEFDDDEDDDDEEDEDEDEEEEEP